jgi:hypothetical protein
MLRAISVRVDVSEMLGMMLMLALALGVIRTYPR